MKKKNLKKKMQAFTLVEVLVSLFIFILIAGILTQIYISTIRSERIAYIMLRDENIVKNELEILARDIRMGREFMAMGDRLEYKTYYDNGWHDISYVFNEEEATIEKKVDNGDVKIVVPKNILIEKLNFEVYLVPEEQPSITITLTIGSVVYKKTYITNLQTTVTPRMLDN